MEPDGLWESKMAERLRPLAQGQPVACAQWIPVEWHASLFQKSTATQQFCSNFQDYLWIVYHELCTFLCAMHIFPPAICFIKWKNDANGHTQSKILEFYFKCIEIWEHDSFREVRCCLELGWDCYCDQPVNVSRPPLWTTTRLFIEFMSGPMKQTGKEG